MAITARNQRTAMVMRATVQVVSVAVSAPATVPPPP
jgi:hypothetical protein